MGGIMKDADRKQAEMIWEHLVRKLRQVENKATAQTQEASGPDRQGAKRPNGSASRGENLGENSDSDWDMQA